MCFLGFYEYFSFGVLEVRELLLSLFFILGTVLTSPAVGGQTIYVDDDGPADYNTIQDGIDAASNGDAVLVRPGTYVENIAIVNKAITLIGEDPDNQATIESTIIDGNEDGTVVYFGGAEASDSTITGFTIQNGSADFAGGILCMYSSPTITKCIIRGNYALNGGGIRCFYSSSVIRNNTVIENETFGVGGGISTEYGSPEIINNNIVGNFTGGRGGGIAVWNEESLLRIENNIIVNNAAGTAAGGVDIVSPPSAMARITNNTISANYIPSSTYGFGGGIAIQNSAQVVIQNNTIIGNSAAYYGGDLGRGGGIECQGSSATISNNTICGNSGALGGGVSYFMPTSDVLTNSILWDNGNDLYNCSAAYSCVEDGDAGTGNIGPGSGGDDPAFVSGFSEVWSGSLIATYDVNTGQTTLVDPVLRQSIDQLPVRQWL